MMQEIKAIDRDGKETILPPVISPKFASTPCCPIPKCYSCELACQKQCSPQVKRSRLVPEKEGSLSKNRYEAGDFVSADQFAVNTPERLFSVYSHEDDCNKFHGVLSFKMLPLRSFGLSVKFLLVLVRPSCQRSVLRNGFGRGLLLKSICTVIMEYSPLTCFMWIASLSINLRVVSA